MPFAAHGLLAPCGSAVPGAVPSAGSIPGEFPIEGLPLAQPRSPSPWGTPAPLKSIIQIIPAWQLGGVAAMHSSKARRGGERARLITEADARSLPSPAASLHAKPLRGGAQRPPPSRHAHRLQVPKTRRYRVCLAEDGWSSRTGGHRQALRPPASIHAARLCS